MTDFIWFDEETPELPDHLGQEPSVIFVDYGLDDQIVLSLWAKSQETGQFVIATRWVSIEDLKILTPEIGHIEGFRFIESPLRKEENMQRVKKVKVSRSYRGQPTGPKELERGVRSYMVTHYPPVYNSTTGELQAPVRRPGHGIVNTMSKAFFDNSVEYSQGD